MVKKQVMSVVKYRNRAELKYLKSFSWGVSLLLISLLLLGFVTSCQKKTEATPDECRTLGTIKDFTGLDGCGWMLVLDNGEKLNPLMMLRCGTPPVAEEPIDKIKWADGKRVRFDYKERKDLAGTCMAGKTVEITCISEIITSDK
jgi:hypothetical protein